MKKESYIFLVPCGIALVALSCSKADSVCPEPVSSRSTEAFSISAGNVFKTVMNDTEGKVIHWSENDALSVFDDVEACQGHLFTSAIDKDDASGAVFTGEICAGASEMVALYPYDAEASCADGVLVSTLPSVQNATDGSFANGSALSAAKITKSPGQESASATFVNLCPVLSFNIPSYLENAVSVVVSSNSGKAMSGSVSVDVETLAITSVSGSSSVTLSGEFTPGGQYYACIAPGIFEDGFTLVVNTSDGKSYSCATTRTLDAHAGTIYYLGTAGLVLSVSPKVVITHTADEFGRLSGSVAELSMEGMGTGPDELVAEWYVSLLNSSSKEVRRIFSHEGTMSMANGYKYIPQGTYTVEASYTLPDGKVRKVYGTALSPAPSFTLSTTGYTSYDCSKGTNGCSKSIVAANSCDGKTIYDLGASVSISNELLSDNKYNSSFTYNLDKNGEVSVYDNEVMLGNLTGQSNSAHSLTAKCTFDGVSSVKTRTLNVTGLPWTNAKPTSSVWELSTNASTRDNSYIRLGGGTGNAHAKLRSGYAFFIPANIDVVLYAEVGIYTLYWGLGYQRTTFTASLAGKDVISKEGEKIKEEKSYSLSGNGTFTTSNNSLELDSSYTVAGPYVSIYSIKINYR